MTLRYRGAVYEIAVTNAVGAGRGVVSVTFDGDPRPPVLSQARLGLCAHGNKHVIVITLGPEPGPGLFPLRLAPVARRRDGRATSSGSEAMTVGIGTDVAVSKSNEFS